MDHVGRDEIESFRMEMEEIGRSIRSSFRQSSLSGSKRDHTGDDSEHTNEWAAIDRLPTFDRLRWSLFCNHDRDNGTGQLRQRQAVDVSKLGPVEMHIFVENLIRHIEEDNLRLLQKQKERIDRVNVKQPTIEIRYKNLCVDAECEVVDGKPLPTLWNSVKSFFSAARKLTGSKSQEVKISILKDVSGIIKPSRLTLLLGPPGCGKTTFLLALAGKLDKSLKVTGEVSYNGYRLEEFVPEKTAAYISQYDLHIPDMTVRETMDFSARFQGVGSREEIMKEVVRREKKAGIIPDPEIDTYMKAISLEGLKRSPQTDYIMKILGLDICSDTMVGDAMRRGISGGQKKRLTTAEMIVGPTKALFMDEISTGLDSSTTYQIVKYLQQVAHISETTLLVSLLQPAPETYDLFDDVILMADGKVVYHGSRVHVLDFFEECGFRCPERKGTADFLQEVLSRNDQEQYWQPAERTYNYVPVDHFVEKFKSYHIGQKLQKDFSESFDRSRYHKDALSFNAYSLPKWELFKACIARELLLMKRNSFVYIFKTTQLMITACVTMTIFIRTRMGVDVLHSNYYMGALFYALILLMVNGFPELAMTVIRLPVFYKQRDLYFYPAWAYAVPNSILKIPISLIESLGWTSLTYYVIGYSPEVGRFFSQFLILFAVHQMSLSLFRFLAALFRTIEKATASGIVTLLLFFLFGGFILARPSLPDWLRWGFWLSPLTYAQIGVTVNEFLAPRWQKISSPNNTTVAHQLLTSRGLDYPIYFYWLSVGGLFGFALLFNVGFTLALTYLKALGRSRAIISREKLLQLQERENSREKGESVSKGSSQNTTKSKTHGKMILPFKPLTISFENVQYYVDTPKEMNERGYTEKHLQLLHDITGSFRPGILTALMGVSGAGKTTLMDVLSGRKTGGIIEGDIRIGGYPKVQDTFARISGYCEQTDIHSAQITVEESLMYSAWLRLPPEIDPTTRSDFVSEVLETIELEGIKDALVGIPGISGLSTEQRKRLTIAVELVSNPSIIFMDEPTSGLDARAAAIVMRAVKNVTATGRTVVCTIHQPSVDIFEAFDELILMKLGGKLIYCGKMGEQSRAVIEYFQGIPGVPKIKKNYNPATWMLEVTSANTEMLLGVDFAHLYKESSIYKDNLEVVRQLSAPSPDSRDLHFSTRYPQNSWVQFKACLWKQYLSYWRNPTYNLIRLMFMTFVSLIFAATFWQRGRTINDQQNLFNMLGSMFLAVILTGINNCTSVLPFIAREREVLYREKFAGMYSPWAYSFAQMTVEIPFSFTQALTFMVIAYPAIGYYMTAFKFFWFFYTIYLTLLYYNYLGMFIASITPNPQVSSILASTFYTFMTLFAGFIVPGKQIPKWWIWFYYMIPTSWTLRGLFTSQYGDIRKEIMVFGEMKPIASFISDYFGFHKDQLPLVAAMLLAYPLIYGSLFAYCIGKLNFQRR